MGIEYSPAVSHLEQERESPTPLFFLTSSKKGLGHISRAVAVANELSEADFAVSLGALPSVQPFLDQSMHRSFQSETVQYDFSPSDLPPDFQSEQRYRDFLDGNRSWLSKLTENSVVITDFVAGSVYLRKFFIENNLDNAQIVGIYHSFEGIVSDDADVMAWQSAVKSVVNALDICFLTEVKSTHDFPHITAEGTLVLPVDPVVSPRHFSDAEVKQMIGMPLEDEYILIQAGMKGNGALAEFVKTIPETSPYYYVLLGWNLNPDVLALLQNHPRVKVIEKMPSGQDFVAAAYGVIAKPGMQTLAEAAVYKVPLLLLPDDHPERKLKIQMLHALTGSSTHPTTLEATIPYDMQIQVWLNDVGKQRAALQPIRGDGARQIADYLRAFSLEKKLVERSQYVRPVPVLDTPPGKSADYLSPDESKEVVRHIRAELETRFIRPLSEAGIQHSFILFGGVAKEMLRPESDVDALLVLAPGDIDQLMIRWKEDMQPPLSEERCLALVSGKVDALRLRGSLSTGREVNISLMLPEGYAKIFQPTVRYFIEELGKKISGSPYHISDFTGKAVAIPKVFTIENKGEIRQERRSPGIMPQEDGATLFGVKHRMLLTAENLHDGWGFGDPTRKLIRGMARAVLFWNDLYERRNGKIIGIKPEAFDENYFFRLLRDPLHMVGPKVQRKMKNLYFNELRRLQVLYKRSE